MYGAPTLRVHGSTLRYDQTKEGTLPFLSLSLSPSITTPPQENTLDESHPKSLFESMPVFWMPCVENKPKIDDTTEGLFRCPVCIFFDCVILFQRCKHCGEREGFLFDRLV